MILSPETARTDTGSVEICLVVSLAVSALLLVMTMLLGAFSMDFSRVSGMANGTNTIRRVIVIQRTVIVDFFVLEIVVPAG